MQLVIVTPLLVLLVLISVQAAVYFHAANVAAATAAEGAAAGAGGDARAATSVAQRTMGELGGAGVISLAIEARVVVVTVDVDVPSLVPFFPHSVRRVATEPLEQFVAESDR